MDKQHPWTLLSNVALVVNPKETYVKIKLTETQENLILAKARLSVVAEDYEIVEEYLGQDLEHKRYERLYDFLGCRRRWLVYRNR